LSLKDERLKLGLTQIEVAKRAGIARRQYQRFESGEGLLSKAHYPIIVSLASVFHTTPKKLIKLQEDEVNGIPKV
jgi:transcriptional regulator with XRE-family HTH domain